jgi:hypothetical protein
MGKIRLSDDDGRKMPFGEAAWSRAIGERASARKAEKAHAAEKASVVRNEPVACEAFGKSCLLL